MENEKLKNMDWMYAKPELKIEDYMLGRKIDKQLIQHVFGEDEDDKAATSVGAAFEQQGMNPTYDQLCKLREDPLVAIKRAEQQKARQVVDNPILMKKFKTYLMQMVEDEKSSKKKKSKSKKNKSKRDRSRSESESLKRKNPEREITKRYNKSRSRSSSTTNKRGNKERRMEQPRSRSNSYDKRKCKKFADGELKRELKISQLSRLRSRSPSRGQIERKGGKDKRRRSKSRSLSHSPEPKTSKSHKYISQSHYRSKSPQESNATKLEAGEPFSYSCKSKNSEKFCLDSGSHKSRADNSRNESRSSKYNKKTSGVVSKGAYVPPKMTAEELERKRRQMMEDAKEHEVVRVKLLKRHEEAMSKEEEQFKKMKYTEDPTRWEREREREREGEGEGEGEEGCSEEDQS